jgi:DNA-binding HxlR family transcriptional regulator
VTEDWQRSRRFVSLVSGRWTLNLLGQLAAGGRRYQDLHEGLDGISHKVLTDTLRRAERDGLIRRHLDSGRMDTANLYELTDLGRSLEEPLAALGQWVEANWDRVETAQRHWAARTTS